MSQSLTGLTFQGLKWSYTSSVIISILQILVTAVLARLLEPKSFGLVALGGVVLRFGSYFAQMGMGSAIVQKEVLSREDVRMAFTSSSLLSLFFFLLFWLVTPVAVQVFDAPELSSLLPVMAISIVLVGLSTTGSALLRREFRFKILASGDVLAYVIGYCIVGIAAAMSGAGVWSLVYAMLAQATTTSLVAYAFARHSLRPYFQWKRGKDLLSFGGRISAIGFLEFISGNLDTLAIGKVLGAAALGLYNRAFMLVNVPMQYLASSFSRVLLPSFSRAQRDHEKIERGYGAATLILGTVLFSACFGIAGAAREIVLILLGEKWVESISLLRILALATPFMLLAHVGAVLLEATAKLRIKFIIQGLNIPVLLTLFFFLLPFGLVALSAAVLISSVATFVAYMAALEKLLSLSQRVSYSNLRAGILSGSCILCVLFLASEGLRLSNVNIVLAFACQILLGVGVLYTLIISPLHVRLRGEISRRLELVSLHPKLTKLIRTLLLLRIEGATA